MAAEGETSPPSVLLSFRASNVRSFRDPIEFSLLSTTLSEKDAVRNVPWRHGGTTLGVLPVAAIFGANGSGKTNLLRAMNDMRSLVLHSFRSADPSGGVARRPFLLDRATFDSPSTFEVDLVLHGVRHQYGFTFDDEAIIEEWAYYWPHGRSALIFHRHGQNVDLGASTRAKSRAVLDLLRRNALYLSTAATANHPMLLPLYDWFARNLLLAEARSRPYRQARTKQLLDDDTQSERVRDLLRAADLGVTGVKRIPLDPVIKERILRSVRVLNGEEGEPEIGEALTLDDLGVRLIHLSGSMEIELDHQDESLGTLVWFGLIGPVVDALSRGSVLLADELDASLHPTLANRLVRLFQDPKSNPHRAQLIFNTHSVSLIGEPDNRILGRDQIWFTEKDSDGSSRLYPLSDMNPRKDESIARRYLAGRYGATPILSDDEFDGVAELITARG